MDRVIKLFVYVLVHHFKKWYDIYTNVSANKRERMEFIYGESTY